MANSSDKEFEWSVKKNHNIDPDERDCNLDLGNNNWYEKLDGRRGVAFS